MAPLFGAIKRMSRSYIRTRPDLFYVPEGTTVPEEFGAASYIHEIRLFPKPGSGRAFTEVMEAFISVYCGANSVPVRNRLTFDGTGQCPGNSKTVFLQKIRIDFARKILFMLTISSVHKVWCRSQQHGGRETVVHRHVNRLT